MIENSIANYILSNSDNLNNIGGSVSGNNGQTSLDQTDDDNKESNNYNQADNINTQQKSMNEQSTNHGSTRGPVRMQPQIQPMGPIAPAKNATGYTLKNTYKLNNIGGKIHGNKAGAKLKESNDLNDGTNKYNETNNINTQQRSIGERSTNHETMRNATPKLVPKGMKT